MLFLCQLGKQEKVTNKMITKQEELHMKNVGKTFKTLALTGLASVALATPVLAVEDSGMPSVGDEYATYGYSLSSSQQANTAKLLGAENVEDDNILIMNQERFAEIFGGSASDVGNIYSSSHLTYEKEGSGVNVNIVTPDTILEVSEESYENALITTGNVDTSLDIASVIEVSGEGALASVFLIQQATGQDLDPEVVALATDELVLNGEVGSEVANENPEASSDESDALTNGLLVDIKNEVAKLAQKNNGEISDKEAMNIVVNVTNNYGLHLSDATIQKLVDFAKGFSKTDISLDPAMQEQLSKLGSTLKEKGGNIWDGVQSTLADPDVQESAGNLWHSIVNFFSNLFGSLTSGNASGQ